MSPNRTTLSRRRSLKRSHPLYALLLSAALMFGVAGEAFAQRVVDVAPGFGTLNDAIHSDTTATGDRVDPNTIYMLQRGGHYALNGGIMPTGNFHLTIDGGEGEGRPAVLQIFSDETGASAADFITSEGNVTIRNLYFLGVDDLGGYRNTVAVMNRPQDARLVVEDIVVDYGRFIAFRFNGENGKLYLSDSFIRNIVTTNNLGNGKIIDPRGNIMDTVHVTNTTFSTVSAEFMRESGAPQKYVHLDHNTFYNVHALLRNDLRFNESKLWKGRITNNLFINMGWPGDTLQVADPDPVQQAGIFVFDSLRVDTLGMSDATRDIFISNNNFFTSQAFLDFYAQADTIQQFPIFSPRAQHFVDQGLVTVEETFELDPEFSDVPGVQDHIDWVSLYWTDPGLITGPFAFDPDGAQNVDTWPLPEDFSYPATSPLYTAGTGGFPLGDLNWFPDRKADWVAVDTESEPELPRGVVLHGNYPNPFNPSTTIRFDLAVPAEVRVEVFDLLGRQVLALPPVAMPSGSDQRLLLEAGSLASGVYLYRLTAESSVQTPAKMGRMVLVK